MKNLVLLAAIILVMALAACSSRSGDAIEERKANPPEKTLRRAKSIYDGTLVIVQLGAVNSLYLKDDTITVRNTQGPAWMLMSSSTKDPKLDEDLKDDRYEPQIIRVRLIN